jgi:hypothetical protein
VSVLRAICAKGAGLMRARVRVAQPALHVHASQWCGAHTVHACSRPLPRPFACAVSLAVFLTLVGLVMFLLIGSCAPLPARPRCRNTTRAQMPLTSPAVLLYVCPTRSFTRPSSHSGTR